MLKLSVFVRLLKLSSFNFSGRIGSANLLYPLYNIDDGALLNIIIGHSADESIKSGKNFTRAWRSLAPLHDTPPPRRARPVREPDGRACAPGAVARRRPHEVSGAVTRRRPRSDRCKRAPCRNRPR